LGSMEISNLGVSSAPAVPITGVLPIVGTVGPSSLVPTMPTIAAPAMASAPIVTTTGNYSGNTLAPPSPTTNASGSTLTPTTFGR
jgi:hypothetical protein